MDSTGREAFFSAESHESHNDKVGEFIECRDMSEHIHQSNLIEDINSPFFDEQAQKAWDFLSEQTSLTHYDVMKVQEIITLLQKDLPVLAKGNYRDIPGYDVWIGARKGPRPYLVPFLMEEWLDRYEELTPKEAHIEFEHIHPFADGNGRTGRMLMWWQEIQLGQEPTLVSFSERQEYYQWFRHLD